MVDPQHIAQGHRYLFTVIDYSTCRPEAIHRQDVTSTSCTAALLFRLMARFGILQNIYSDKDTTFNSQLWTSLGQLLGITLHQTNAYNPAARRMVEHFHCTLKDDLMSRCTESRWFPKLPWVFHGLKTPLKDTIYVSVVEMVYGNPMVVLAEFCSIYDLLG
ncbi:uncharacterized protein [Palaemon carinicauda]|uniref:uncharacterized protein n=1 Tax=Palaemon carinicauda TaxID=392227 RepID=UPI0035B619F1